MGLPVSWDDLRYVLAVARTGTISDAARSLQVNGTTVSRRLRTIEEEAGTALFEKLKHGAVLTPAGHEMVAVAEAVEQLTNDLDARIHGLDTRLEGTIRVTSTDMMLHQWMPDLAAFRDRYPNVDLELVSSYSMASLTRREADVAVRIARDAPPHLIGRKHAEVMYAVYGSEALVDSVGADASYASYPWLAWDPGVARATDNYLERHVKGARVVLRVDSVPVMIDALRAGLGLTILPCLACDPVPGLRRVGSYFEGGTHLWVLTHPELRGTARVRAFTDFMREVIERDRALIEGRPPAA